MVALDPRVRDLTGCGFCTGLDRHDYVTGPMDDQRRDLKGRHVAAKIGSTEGVDAVEGCLLARLHGELVRLFEHFIRDPSAIGVLSVELLAEVPKESRAVVTNTCFIESN